MCLPLYELVQSALWPKKWTKQRKLAPPGEVANKFKFTFGSKASQTSQSDAFVQVKSNGILKFCPHSQAHICNQDNHNTLRAHDHGELLLPPLVDATESGQKQYANNILSSLKPFKNINNNNNNNEDLKRDSNQINLNFSKNDDEKRAEFVQSKRGRGGRDIFGAKLDLDDEPRPWGRSSSLLSPLSPLLTRGQMEKPNGNSAAGAANTAAAAAGPSPPQQPPPHPESFRIKTLDRRHVDFDQVYDLADTQAPERSKWAGPFHFIQAADCQFGMIDSYVHHRTEPGWSEEIELCERLVSVCNQMAPRPLFMIICGDLVDSLPASEIGSKQVLDFKRIFAKLSPQIPLVCVCGNHDVGDEPTRQTIADYRSTFGDDYFYFTKHDILFIVINSQFYQHRAHVEREAADQDAWLETVLAKCKLFKYSIVFEHIPWFLEHPDEENDYFNIRKEVRLGWLRKFCQAGVTKIMCGHYHRNAGGWFEGMELVVTSAIGAQCGSDKSGIRIVKVFEDSIEHQYYAMADIPLNIELKKTSSTSGCCGADSTHGNNNNNNNNK